RVAIDKAALFLVGQKGDGPGNVVWRRESAHGYAACDIGVGVAASGLVCLIHLRLHPAGADRIYADPAASPLGGQRAGEADQTVLGSVIGRAVRNAEEPCDGGDIDDRSTARFEHFCAEGLCQKKWRNQVDFDHIAERCGCGRFCRLDQADAGIVHQHICSSEAAEHLLGKITHRWLVGHVTCATDDVSAILPDCPSGPSRIMDVDDGDPITLRPECLCRAASDPLRRSGHNSYAIMCAHWFWLLTYLRKGTHSGILDQAHFRVPLLSLDPAAWRRMAPSSEHTGFGRATREHRAVSG